MNFIKIHLKLIIGIAALLLVCVLFFVLMRGGELENGNLRNWVSASDSRRLAATKILLAGDENAQLVADCITKVAMDQRESGAYKVRDVAALCAVGVALNSEDK